MSPLVSVIIPTYNRASIIGRTIENVFEQTYSNFEVIVVDDGSVDETQTTLKRFGGSIRVITQANGGPAAARNRGIEAARGEIIAFQDSDDLWMPTKLARQISLLDRVGSSVSCCLCNARMEFTTRPVTTSFDLAPIRPPLEEGVWSNVPEVLATTFVLFNQCVAIRTQILRKIGGFNESMDFMEDYDLAFRLALEEHSWAYIREPMVIWRQGSLHSLYQGAMKREIRMREYSLATREYALRQVKTSAHNAGLEKLLAREVKRNKRELAFAKLAQKHAIGKIASRVLKRVERYRKAIFRRSPWYPHPRFDTVVE
jgi:glycosyltransferase involved in cell wall biosynthesis